MAYREDDIDPVQVGIRVAKWVAVFVIGLILVFGTFYTVKSGEEGVLLTFGKAAPEGIPPGLHVKFPMVQKVIKFDVKTQKYEADAAAASSDLQVVSTKIAVNYHLTPGTTPTLFKDIGASYEDRVIQPSVQEVVKSTTAKFSAEDLITRREDVKLQLQSALYERLITRSIVVEDISITNFDFSESFNQAIEQKVTAEQLKLKAERDLERIRIEAEQVSAKAEGEANAIVWKAKAETEQIRLIQDQLSESPQYIEWLKWSKWNGVLPMVMGGNGFTPLISIPTSKE